MEKPVIVVENLTKYYADGSDVTKALDGVSFEVNEGDFIAIVGPSGSGKTTLIRLLGLKMPPTSGNIFLMGEDISRVKKTREHIYRQKIGVVEQDYRLISWLDALGNVAIALGAKNIGIKEASEKARRVLKSVGLGHRLHHPVKKLSGGEQQRVAIARAIVVEPAILLADEPTGNLDQGKGEKLLEQLFELNRKGQTILFVTHDKSIAKKIGNIMTIVDGKIASHESRGGMDVAGAD